MAYAIGQKLGADDLNDMTPSGDVTVGDDVFLGTGGVVTMGGDTNLYRSSADNLKTDDTMRALQYRENSAALSVSDVQVTAGTTSSSSYTATLSGGTACGKAFVAPQSGSVRVFNTVQLSAAAGNCFCTIRVRTGGTVGAGSDVLAALDDNAVITGAGMLARITVQTVVIGLTPGTTYNVQELFKNDASSSTTATRKNVDVEPVLM